MSKVTSCRRYASLSHSPEAPEASETPSHAYTRLVLGVFTCFA